MKKNLVLLTAIIMVLSLAACGRAGKSIQTITKHFNESAETNLSDLEENEDDFNESVDEQEETGNFDEQAVEQEETESSDEQANSQEKAENSGEQTDSQEQTEEQESIVNNESSSVDGIRPEFKETMDSYEAFFDEYVEFMKKYSSSTDSMSLLTDYLNFMTRYADTMEKLEKIDESALSTAEALYYTEVMTRIYAKLLEATN